MLGNYLMHRTGTKEESTKVDYSGWNKNLGLWERARKTGWNQIVNNSEKVWSFSIGIRARDTMKLCYGHCFVREVSAEWIGAGRD